MATGDKKYVIMQTDRGKAGSYGFAPQTQISDVEASATAAQAYAIGDYFALNGYFYRATAAISIGDTISPGSGSGNNCVATNIAAELVARQVEITNTTPTNLTGLLKGNGSTVGVAAAGTDYATPAAVTATQQDIAYVLADPAGVNVASGLYVIYNNAIYKTTAAISSSEAASSFTSKLTAVTGGIGNELKAAIRGWFLIKQINAAPEATFGFVDTDISLNDYVAIGAFVAFDSNYSVRFSNLDASSTPPSMLRFQIVDCTGDSGNGSVLKSGQYYVYILLMSRAGAIFS